jgi:hypothetical protein
MTFKLLTVAFLAWLAFAVEQARGLNPDKVIAGLRCIHRHEGAWTDRGGPYYGGLQMNLAFQRAYGPEFLRAFGTADNWPVPVQLAVGLRGYLHRGWQPWPATSRLCGLR